MVAPMPEYASKTLYYQHGTSDKVYRVVLRSSDGSSILYDVEASYGRRGNGLKTVPKLVRVRLNRARIEFEKIVDDKLAQGYTENVVKTFSSGTMQVKTKPLLIRHKPSPEPVIDDFFHVGQSARRIKE